MFQNSYFFNILSSFQNSYSGRPGSPTPPFYAINQPRHYKNMELEDNIYFRPENIPQALSYRPIQGAGLPPDFSSLLQAGLLQSQQSEKEFDTQISNIKTEQKKRQYQFTNLFRRPAFTALKTKATSLLGQ